MAASLLADGDKRVYRCSPDETNRIFTVGATLILSFAQAVARETKKQRGEEKWQRKQAHKYYGKPWCRKV